jgi:hypothetical protein
MSSLADLQELVGFFCYSREDDEDSCGSLSALRERIQRELRGQLGRSMKTLRLWQDKEAIASGKLWEAEITKAIRQSVFFIPLITPTVVKSKYCRFELDEFLARETALGRDDLVFPILYIKVPALDDRVQRQNDPVLSIIAKRQYVDWCEFRHLDVTSTDVKKAVERFCVHIRDALYHPWVSPEERKAQEAAAQHLAEAERERQQVEAKRREDEARKKGAEYADPLDDARDPYAELTRIIGQSEPTFWFQRRGMDEVPRRKREAEAEQHLPPNVQPAPARQKAPAPASILKSGVVDGMSYTLYSDGSIEAQLPDRKWRFGSITELRNHIEKNS